MRLKQRRVIKFRRRGQGRGWILLLVIIAVVCVFAALWPHIERRVRNYMATSDGWPTEIGNTYMVTRVIDGDTFEVLTPDGASERVRVRSIDTPEIGGAACDHERTLALEAKSLATEWLLNTNVRLSISPTEQRDRYGRLLANVRMQDGRDFGHAIMDEGLAVGWPNAHDWCE